MATAATFDLACNRGTLLEHSLTYYTDETYATPVDLTGKHARLIIKHRGEDLYTITDTPDADLGELTLGGVAGTILIHVWPALTAQFNDDMSYILVVDPEVDPIMAGQLKVLPGV